MSRAFHTVLRSETAACHAAVDAAFGRFDLADRGGYAAFLTAHARALPVIEAVLVRAGETRFRPRAPLLAHDLAELESAMPSPLSLAPPASDAERAGMLYVIEGSRLGGGLLARQVPDGLPSRYLSATHQPGEWRTLLARLDEEVEGEEWLAEAVAGARATFALYEQAASQ